MDRSSSTTGGYSLRVANTKKRKKRKLLVFEDGFAIDEDDHITLCEIFSTCSTKVINYLAREYIDGTPDRRISKIKKYLFGDGWISSTITSLPSSLGSLSNLKEMNISCSRIASLPPSIGYLNNLEILDLSYTENLSNLPQEIGNLARLEKLNLSRSAIAMLPDSLARLQSLKKLDLSGTKHLTNLPQEIGNLARLEKLDLCQLAITKLPDSLARLKSLKILDLGGTKNLLNVPEEIGNLTSLEVLSLRHSNISSLPSSIGRLQNLESLYLCETPNLSTLPQELGAPRRLRFYLDGSKIMTLSFLARVDIMFKLARVRARSLTGYGTKDYVGTVLPKLWPLLLGNAVKAFDSFPYKRLCACDETPYQVQAHDALYHLLQDGMGYFHLLLLDRAHCTPKSR